MSLHENDILAIRGVVDEKLREHEDRLITRLDKQFVSKIDFEKVKSQFKVAVVIITCALLGVTNAEKVLHVLKVL